MLQKIELSKAATIIFLSIATVLIINLVSLGARKIIGEELIDTLYSVIIFNLLSFGLAIFAIVKRGNKVIGIGLIIGGLLNVVIWIMILYELSNHGW